MQIRDVEECSGQSIISDKYHTHMGWSNYNAIIMQKHQGIWFLRMRPSKMLFVLFYLPMIMGSFFVYVFKNIPFHHAIYAPLFALY